MPGLDPGIHRASIESIFEMGGGSSPAMTTRRKRVVDTIYSILPPRMFVTLLSLDKLHRRPFPDIGAQPIRVPIRHPHASVRL